MADTERILDAAGELFASRGVAAVDMSDIARASGCSRATLYRCFDNRAALRAAYVHREARTVANRLAELTAAIEDPRERLLTGITHALRLVRESPPLSAWFADTAMGAQAAASSDVVLAMTASFLLGLDGADREAATRRARWLVRVLASFLTVPGRDADEERSMLEEFVAPLIGGRTTTLAR